MAKSPARRRPQQERSRERVELILATARKLIGTRGSDAVSMRDIASAAGIPISSIYQYFPDKPALLQTILKNYLLHIHQQLLNQFAGAASRKAWLAQIDPAIDQFFALFEADPALAVIWSGALADPTLCQQNAQVDLNNARMLADQLRALNPAIDVAEAETALLFLLHSTGSAIQLASALPPPQVDQLKQELKQLLRTRVQQLLKS